jgi:hypothetical protein
LKRKQYDVLRKAGSIWLFRIGEMKRIVWSLWWTLIDYSSPTELAEMPPTYGNCSGSLYKDLHVADTCSGCVPKHSKKVESLPPKVSEIRGTDGSVMTILDLDSCACMLSDIWQLRLSFITSLMTRMIHISLWVICGERRTGQIGPRGSLVCCQVEQVRVVN